MKVSPIFCVGLWTYCGCTASNYEKSSLDDLLQEPSSSLEAAVGEDSLRAFYLLEQSTDTENRLWVLDVYAKEYYLLGVLDCPFSIYNDQLAAMTADPKGILWGLSEEYEIMQIIPATLSCSAFPQRASNEDFQAESLAFIQTEEGTEFFLAGYYSNPNGASSTALATMTANGISILSSITNLSGQDTVIDIDTTPDQRLFGYRGWGNLSELVSLSKSSGTIQESQTIYISTAQNFALLSDNQSHWFFTDTGTEGSQLHREKNGVWEWWIDLPFTIVGASGIE